MKQCDRCGKRIAGTFSLCYECHWRMETQRLWREHDAKTPQEREDEREAYYNTECVMCGKEGASTRKDGKAYCGTCWMTWNS